MKSKRNFKQILQKKKMRYFDENLSDVYKLLLKMVGNFS